MQILDNYVVYRFLSILTYITFFLTSLIATKEGSTPIFPNLFAVVTTICFTFIFSTMSQVLEPIDYERRWLIKRFVISAIPPILGLIIAYRFLKFERRVRRDQLFEIMAIVSIIMLTVMSLMYTLILLLIYVSVAEQILVFYFMTLGMTGLIGISIADSGAFYTSELDYNTFDRQHRFTQFKQKSSIMISTLLGTSRKRISIAIVTTILISASYYLLYLYGADPVEI